MYGYCFKRIVDKVNGIHAAVVIKYAFVFREGIWMYTVFTSGRQYHKRCYNDKNAESNHRYW